MTDYNETDIAIVGMAAHLPGARNIDEFWKNLLAGVESVEVYSDESLKEAGIPREHLRNPRYVKLGAPLPDMEMFDGEFFGFSPKESAIVDPQHRHFLEACWEALEDASHAPGSFDGPIGVFGGCGMGSYYYFNLCTNPDLVESVGHFLLRHTGNDKDFLCTRVSHILDLKGPSVSVQTACSSSLVATHYAIQSLLSQECDMALAGGVTIELPHRTGYFFKEGEVLSPDGHCHAFDHRGQGTVFGSGVGVVALRRLADAQRDGDHIHAVIRGSAVNNDGASKAGYLAPSVSGQAAAVVEALTLSDVTAESVGYVECHGTGTYLGDPIEISALTEAFRQTTEEGEPVCKIGSLKTNIGHLDTAAGVASLIKAALTVKTGEVPASLNFEKPNPEIDFDGSPFVVNDKHSTWDGPLPRRAGVNSLGVGGTNAHVIVQEPPPQAPSSKSKRAAQPIIFSAKNRGSLDGYQARLGAYLKASPQEQLGDVAWTLLKGRTHFDRFRLLAAQDLDEAATILQENDPRKVITQGRVGDNPPIVFMFPGGGSQYARMGLDLHRTEPVFRKKFDEGIALLQPKVDYDPRALLFGDDVEAAEVELRIPSRQLPLTVIVEVALYELFKSWGLTASALIGHSLGEYSAACIAGVFSLDDTIRLVLKRGEIMDKTEPGGMISVQLSKEELAPLLGTELDLACHNAPGLCVVSGREKELASFEERLAERDVESQRIVINVAAHSRLLEPGLGDFRELVKSLRLQAPTLKVISNVSGELLTAAEATDPEYWVRHLRQTIKFEEGIALLAQDEDRIYLECGPGRALSSLAKIHSSISVDQVIGGMRHKGDARPDETVFMATLVQLWAAGVDIEIDRIFEGEQRRRVRLPTYAFQKRHYFIEPGEMVAQGAATIERGEAVGDFGWEAAWQPHAPGLAEQGQHCWLVFLDDSGVGQRVVRTLKNRGEQVSVVRAGDAYQKRSDSEFILSPEHGRDGYDSLIRDLVQAQRAPDRILHFWLTTADESFRPGSSFFHRNLERGFYSLLFLAQAVADENLAGPMHLSVITNSMVRITGEELTHASKSTALGPIQVIPREFPDFTVSALDFELPQASNHFFGGRLAMALVDPFAGRKAVTSKLDQIAELICEEVLGTPKSCQAALRDGRRYEKSYAKRTLAEAQPELRSDGAYLITGGLGGLGLVAADNLVKWQSGIGLVLVGRSAMPARDDWDEHLETQPANDPTSLKILRVRELESHGARVMVTSADVTNVDQMQKVVDEAKRRFGCIRGVLHTAGVVADDLIQIKGLTEIEDVFAPKVHGTLVLDKLFGNDPDCDFMLLYASTSTAIGSAGQVDYVAANSFLNAYAQSRNGQMPRTIAVNWGIWSQVGMAADAFDNADRSAGPDELPPTNHPLFDGRRRDRHGQTYFFGLHSPSSHWIYEEHRVLVDGSENPNGHALIPGTGYLELASAALAQIEDEVAFEIRDLFFIRPLQIRDGQSLEVRVRLRRSREGYSFEVRSPCQVDGRTGWQLHAQASLALGQVPKADAVSLDEVAAKMTGHSEHDPAGLRSPQEDHLTFGPRWRVLQDVAYGDREALATIQLPEGYDDLNEGWRLHPAMMDLATGYAMELIEGYQADSLWVPVSYESVRVFGVLPSRVKSWVRSAGDNKVSDDFAYFDIDIIDPEDGRVLVAIHRFAIRRLEGELSLVTPPRDDEIEPDPDARDSEERNLSPAEQRLRNNLERGILPEEGGDALGRVLASDANVVYVSSLDLPGLIAEAAQAQESTGGGGAKFERPDLDSDYLAPRDSVERALVGFWEELLGVDQVGIQDSFFDLGGHSLIAVRLFAMVKRAYQVEFPISVLFEAPTIEACAALIRDVVDVSDGDSEDAPPRTEAPKRRYTHLVAMHPNRESTDKTPFFLVAGMFGNVLNLRHLAHLIGSDRPFYGLQAKGLYGDDQPHQTFEEAATAYIEEMRTVQSCGPYMVGGFSGGGYIALEIARQLRKEGEEISLVVLLDTPGKLVPEQLNWRDRATIQRQRFETKGPAYFVEWAQNRAEWEVGKLRRRFEEPEDLSSAEFHNEAIEAAFRSALDRYQMPTWDQQLVLFRPPLQRTYELGEGRILNSDREYVFNDNGWSERCSDVVVFEVPGDHDSMVLEPNVRVMAAKLRELIEKASAVVPEPAVTEVKEGV